MIGILLAIGGAALLYKFTSSAGAERSVPNLEPAELLERYDALRENPEENASEMKAIAEKLNQLKWTRNVVVKGTGNQYRLRLVNVFSDGVRMYDVFTLPGNRLVRYKQQGDDTTTRKYVDSPPDVSEVDLGRAAADFKISRG